MNEAFLVMSFEFLVVVFAAFTLFVIQRQVASISLFLGEKREKARARSADLQLNTQNSQLKTLQAKGV
jgi:hypothetical protein